MATLAAVVVSESTPPTDSNRLAAVVVRRLAGVGAGLAAVVVATSAVDPDPAQQNSHLAAVVVRTSGDPNLSRVGWYRTGAGGAVPLALYRRTAGGAWA